MSVGPAMCSRWFVIVCGKQGWLLWRGWRLSGAVVMQAFLALSGIFVITVFLAWFFEDWVGLRFIHGYICIAIEEGVGILSDFGCPLGLV